MNPKNISPKECSQLLSKMLESIEEFNCEMGDAYDNSWTQEQMILCNLFSEDLSKAERKCKWLLSKIKNESI
jgi:hypothetical protein